MPAYPEFGDAVLHFVRGEGDSELLLNLLLRRSVGHRGLGGAPPFGG